VALIGAASLVALVVGGFAAVHSPLVKTHSIRVSGTSHLSSERVLKLAGLAQGTNVFFLDIASVERRLETNPWIARAIVRRSLPRTVTISVQERVPVAAIGDAGVFDQVASDGTILAKSKDRPALPLIVASGPPDVAGAAAVAGAMQPALRSQVDTVNVDPGGEVSVTLRSGLVVTFGSASDPAAKDRSLASLLHWSAQKGVRFESADVSVPSAPTAKVVGGRS